MKRVKHSLEKSTEKFILIKIFRELQKITKLLEEIK